MKQALTKFAAGVACLLALIVVGVEACSGAEDDAAPPIVLQLVDERGVALAEGSYRLGDTLYTADSDGKITIPSIDRPRMGLVEAPQKIVEPVAIGWRDRGHVVEVQLLDDKDNRWVYHAGGDVMFGRRYLTPDAGEPLLDAQDGGESAVALVSNVAEVFAAADLRTVNVETVVGDLPDSSRYPGKRWILLSPANSLAALEAMSVDLAVLGNNHLRDYLDEGVQSTIDALDQHQLGHVGGAALDAAQPSTFVDIKGLRVGFLAYTTVDGDFVNDSYPPDSATPPADLADADQWLWDTRTWGFTAGSVDIPVAERRIGGAWRAYAAAEVQADEATIAEMYAALVAVYPEIQDWVARRGHGGSARFWADSSPQTITATAAEADVTIVQLHSGFQFSSSPSDTLHANARAAIDAGADIVVCHHPHVLQGLEYYRGKLIVYSLGNLIFDQDFFATYNTMILRTVWEGDQLIQTRLIPMQLDAYVPVFATDEAADLVLADLWRKSLQSRVSERGPDSRVYPVETALDEYTTLPGFSFERHTARVEPGLPQATIEQLTLEPGEIRDLPACAALHRGGAAPPDGLQLGVELFGWGHFEDVDTDEQRLDMTHWAYEKIADKQLVSEACHAGEACLQLRRETTSESSLLLRPVSRIPLQAHRGYRKNGDVLEPADGPSQLMVRLFAKASARHDAYIRLSLYHFDDLDPTMDPSTVDVRELELPFDTPADGQWHEHRLLPTAQDMQPATPDQPVNYMLPYIVLPPPSRGADVVLSIDDLSLVEWREASRLPEGYGVYQLMWNSSEQALELELELVNGCGSTDPGWQ